MKFYLGTSRPHWLEFNKIPLFISYRKMRRRKNFAKKAKCDWALDSGGFSELSLFGKWTIDARTYAKDIRLYEEELGRLDFAAIQDWMCEPFILAKTGLSIEEHQKRTCDSFLELKDLNPHTNFIPILQGWEMDDYLRHIDLYTKLNIDLTKFDTVGVGSVCRRQSTDEIGMIMKTLYNEGIKTHGFGVKVKGIKKYKDYMTSADSLVWSFKSRYTPALPGCTHKHCSDCYKFAIKWYKETIDPVLNPKPVQKLKRLKSIIKYIKPD